MVSNRHPARTIRSSYTLRGIPAGAVVRSRRFGCFGFALATKLSFMLSGHVAFPEQNSLLLARTTKILARLVEELAFVEPGNPTNIDWSS